MAELYDTFANETVSGTAGDDTIISIGGNDTINGGDGDDVITKTSGGNAIIYGGRGNDTITYYGYETTASIFAGEGNDLVLIGSFIWGFDADLGAGDDTIALLNTSITRNVTLGTGVDRVIVLSGGDYGGLVISDFAVGASGDVLDLSTYIYRQSATAHDPIAPNPFASGHLLLVQDGADTLVYLDVDGAAGGTGAGYSVKLLRLEGVTATALTAANFAGYDPAGADPVIRTITGTAGSDTLFPEAVPGIVNGADGNDRLFGGYADDNLQGGAGDDVIESTLAGNDTLDGGDGNDRITDTFGSDIITGGAGNDEIIIRRETTFDPRERAADLITIAAGGGDDLVSFDVTPTNYNAYYGSFAVDLGEGNDVLQIEDRYFGGTLTLGAGVDRMQFGQFLFYAGSGFLAKTITVADFQAGAGGDVFDMSAVFPRTHPESLNPFADGYLRIVQDGADVLVGFDYDGIDKSDSLQILARLTGVAATSLVAANFAGYDPNGAPPVSTVFSATAGADTFKGTAGADTVSGLGGNDILSGSGGNDSLSGDAGDDVIDGGGGNDVLRGGDGNDTLTDLDLGNDIIEGGAGNDTITVVHRVDTGVVETLQIDAGSGDDQVSLTFGNAASINLGEGSDRLTLHALGAGGISVTTGSGSDIVSIAQVVASQDVGTLTFSDFTPGDNGDRLDWLGFAQADLYLGVGDNPFAVGAATLEQDGADVLFKLIEPYHAPHILARFSNTTLASFSNYNFGVDISARPLADTLVGTPGNDTLTGTGVDDRGDGGAGADSISGGTGNDTLLGGADSDTLNGDAGNDILDGGTGGDTINGGIGDDTITDIYGNDLITAGDGNDTITIKGEYGDPTEQVGRLDAGAGNDVIYVEGVAQGYSFNAGSGNDVITFGGASFTTSLTLGAGSDTVRMAQFVGNGYSLVLPDFATGANGDVFDVRPLQLNLLPGGFSLPEGADLFELGYINLVQNGGNVELWVNPTGLPSEHYSSKAAIFSNKTIAQFTSVNFAGSDPVSDYVGPVAVRGDFTVAAGTTETINGDTPGVLRGPGLIGLGNYNFVNHGTVNVGRTSSGGDPVGFAVDFSASGSSFVNAADGVIAVTDETYVWPKTPFPPFAMGYYNPSNWGSSFLNHGLISVNSTYGSATGVVTGYGYDPGSNHGTIEVNAGLDAIGVQVGGKIFTNTGSILVHGDLFAVGMWVRQWASEDLVNSGDIIVSVDPGSEYNSFGILIFGSYPDNLKTINSGTIRAEFAFYIAETSPSSEAINILANSGTIDGIVFLNDGDDRIENSGEMFGATLLGNDADTYDGTAGYHYGTVEAGEGNDLLLGGGLGETFYGDNGSDQLIGGGGDDWLDGGEGSDLLDGGDGFDTLSFMEATSAMVVDMRSGVATGGIDRDYFRNIEAVVGSRGNDTITGGAGDDLIVGLGGNDQIGGGAGRDILAGWLGNDTITTGDGADRVIFSVGDGTDAITDLGADDVIEIYGYAAAQSITQVGSDVRITLSATDSITIKGKTVAQVPAANLSFGLDTLPFTLKDPPSRTLAQTSDLIVAAGQELSFTDTFPVLRRIHNLESAYVSTAVQLSNTSFGGASPGLWLAGTIRYEGFSDLAEVTGVSGTPNGSDVSKIVIQTGGRLEVLAHASDAAGLSITDAVFNLGTISVVSETGNATALVAPGGAGVVNRGTITVEALNGTARGSDPLTTSSTPGAFFNTGTMTVKGGEASTGYELRWQFESTFVNSGSIIVTDQTSAPDSVAISVGVGGSGQLCNSGTIRADYAIRMPEYFSYSELNQPTIKVYNTGEIFGTVSLSTYVDHLVNQGSITGNVWLGGGADIYDGRLGQLTGLIDGYDGNDTILAGVGTQTILGGFGDDILSGGAGADTLTGGKGRDHFRFGTGDGKDVITDFAGGASGDLIDVSGYTAYQSITQVGADVVVTFSANDTLTLRGAVVAQVTSAISFGAAAIAPLTIPTVPTTPTAPAAPTAVLAPVQDFVTLVGGSADDALRGSGANETFNGGDGADRFWGLGGADSIDGGSHIDTAVLSGNRSAYTITQTSTGMFRITGPDGTDTLTRVEYAEFADQTLRLLPGTGVTVNFTTNPATYMSGIRDFDGNDLGGASGWRHIGSADVNGDGDADEILVNRQIGRFAEVGMAADGKVYFSDHGWAGETRVVGTYIDPLVASGQVVAGSDHDSQRRFQNDLLIENITRVLGADDYDGDGWQEVYFALTDGSAYLHAYMHGDGNIRYANYQSEAQVIEFLTGQGFGSSTWAGWFD